MTTTRRLAAIVFADVVGYARLMGEDEAGTLAALRERRKAVVEPLTKQHAGRVVKFLGDGVLIEFASAVNAVAFALDLQRCMAEMNEPVAEARRIQLRVGINLGEVVGEGADIYGDGVNIAARLEGIAEPGGICISAKVHEEVRGKVDADFADLGEQQLKNIAQSVRAYRLGAKPLSDATVVHAADELIRPPKSDRTSVAVLPFTNMSGDPAQDYFSDGLTEDLITELARFRDLFVIARNSTFVYKGQSVDISEVGHRLGARYVVEGSVRRAGKRVRVTAQLIQVANGTHLWAERYDRDVDDIFAVQDEVVAAIAGAIQSNLGRHAIEHVRRKPPANLTAYDCELRGRWAMAHWNEGLEAAIAWYEKALAADPEYALAHAGMAMAYAYGLFVLGLPAEEARSRAKQHAGRALVLDNQNPTVSAYATFSYHVSGEPQLALNQAARSVALNPNDPSTNYVQACALSYGGHPMEALESFARSERLNPYAADDQRLDTLCDCYYHLRQYDKAVEVYETYQNMPAYLYLPYACHLAQSGLQDRANLARESYFRLRPAKHDPAIMVKYHMEMCLLQEDRDHWLDGFRKLGFDV